MLPQDEARDPDTPTTRLSELAIDPRLGPVIAANPGASPVLLRQLAQTTNSAVRAAVASNPNAALDTLLDVAQAFPDEFFANPVLPFFLLECPSLLADAPDKVALALMRSAHALPLFINQFAARTDDAVIAETAALHISRCGEWPLRGWQRRARAAAARFAYSGNLPPCGITAEWLLDWLVENRWPHTRRAVFLCPDLPLAVIRAAAADTDAHIRQQIAQNPAAPADVIECLAHDSEAIVRIAVARRHDLPLPLLARFSRDTVATLRYLVACNFATTPEILAHLAHDSHAATQIVAAHRLDIVPRDASSAYFYASEDWPFQEGTDPDQLDAYAGNAYVRVRRAIMHNPHFTANAAKLRRFMTLSPAHRLFVAEYPLTPPEILEKLTAEYAEEDLWVTLLAHPHACADLKHQVRVMLLRTTIAGAAPLYRIGALSYPNLPTDILTTYVTSSEWMERLVIARNPATPIEIVGRLACDGIAPVRAAAQARMALAGHIPPADCYNQR